MRNRLVLLVIGTLASATVLTSQAVAAETCKLRVNAQGNYEVLVEGKPVADFGQDFSGAAQEIAKRVAAGCLRSAQDELTPACILHHGSDGKWTAMTRPRDGGGAPSQGDTGDLESAQEIVRLDMFNSHCQKAKVPLREEECGIHVDKYGYPSVFLADRAVSRLQVSADGLLGGLRDVATRIAEGRCVPSRTWCKLEADPSKGYRILTGNGELAGKLSYKEAGRVFDAAVDSRNFCGENRGRAAELTPPDAEVSDDREDATVNGPAAAAGRGDSGKLDSSVTFQQGGVEKKVETAPAEVPDPKKP